MANVTQESTRDADDAMSVVQQNSVTQDIHGLFCSSQATLFLQSAQAELNQICMNDEIKNLTWRTCKRATDFTMVSRLHDF